jgi:DNA-binding MarR family transcriptional regulator
VPSRDRRQRVIRLTPQGAALFTEIWQVSERKYAAIEDTFGSEELRDLVVSLNRLRACLETEEKPRDRRS